MLEYHPWPHTLIYTKVCSTTVKAKYPVNTLEIIFCFFSNLIAMGRKDAHIQEAEHNVFRLYHKGTEVLETTLITSMKTSACSRLRRRS